LYQPLLTEERNYQVQIMCNIYRRATYVYVWLGPSDPYTKGIMDKLKVAFRQHHYHGSRAIATRKEQEVDKNNDEVMESLSAAELQHFFSNAYWRRLWIVQEIMLVRYIRIMCGKSLLSWEEVKRICTKQSTRFLADGQRSVP
jgi:hypothetical protein